MNSKERVRAGVMKRVSEKEITQQVAAELLEISERQVKRLAKRFREEGEAGLVSRKIGKGNRGFKENFKRKVLDLIKLEYPDFKPTFASEKLEENHGIKVNRETLRQWMQIERIWKGRKRSKARIHQSR